MFGILSTHTIYANTSGLRISNQLNDTRFNTPFLVEFENGGEPSFDDVSSILAKIYSSVPNEKFVCYDTSEVDELGQTHFRFKQYSMGILMEFSHIIVHCQGNKILSINGEGYRVENQMIVLPSISEAKAIKIAIKNAHSKQFAWENKGLEKSLKISKENENATYKPLNASLVFAPIGGIFNSNNFKLCYKVDVYSLKPLERFNYYIDAQNGEIVYKSPTLYNVNKVGKAVCKYSDTQVITTDSFSKTSLPYRLKEKRNGCQISTVDAANSNADITDNDNFWTNKNSSYIEAANDAHWSAECTYDLYYNVFKRKSYDGKNGTIISNFNSFNGVNAYWSGSEMYFGTGDGSNYFPLTSIDVAGHELTHGVTQTTAGLVYSYESGALNEAMSDIFGTTLEFINLPKRANWLMGDLFDKSKKGFRDMANPSSRGMTPYYLGTKWYSGSVDNGGVHSNSSVANYYFYLTSKGGSGKNDSGNNFKVTGVGIDHMSKIIFRTLSKYLTSSSDYPKWAIFIEKSAKELYGTCAPEYRTAVDGLYACQLRKTPLDTTKVQTFSLDFTAKQTYACTYPYIIDFANQSTGAGNFAWDFGDGTTSKEVSPSHTYLKNGKYSVKLIGSPCFKVNRDSLTKINFAKTDSSLSICKAKVIPNNSTKVDTNFNGILFDSGKDKNYLSSNFGLFTIFNDKYGELKLNFSEFDYRENIDFITLFDGIDTSSKIIGVFTGKQLKDTSIIVSSGTVTILETSLSSSNAIGFEMEWQYLKPRSNDLAILDVSINRIKGYAYTTNQTMTNNELVTVKFRNVGSNRIISPDFYFTANGKTVKETYPFNLYPNDSGSLTFTKGADLSNLGINPLTVFHKWAGDSTPYNNLITLNAFQLDTFKPIDLGTTIDFQKYANNHWIGNSPFSTLKNSEFNSGQVSRFAFDDFTSKIGRGLILDNIYSRYKNYPNVDFHFNLDKFKGIKSQFVISGWMVNNKGRASEVKVYFKPNDSATSIYVGKIPSDTGKKEQFFDYYPNIDSVLMASKKDFSSTSELRIEYTSLGSGMEPFGEKSALILKSIQFNAPSNYDYSIQIVSPSPSDRSRLYFKNYLNDTVPLKFNIKKLGLNPVSSIIAYYQVDGGMIYSDTVPISVGKNNLFTTSKYFDFSKPKNHTIKSWIELAKDNAKGNDTITTEVLRIDNKRVIIPFTENFEKSKGSYVAENAILGIPKFDKWNASSNACAQNINFGVLKGNNSNASMALINNGNKCSGSSSDYILNSILNLNLEAYKKNDLYFSCDYYPYNLKSDTSDYISIRGDEFSKWIKILVLPNNTKPGYWYNTGKINISSLLSGAGQVLSKTTQIKFNTSATSQVINDSTGDGYKFDNIKLDGNITDIAILKLDSPFSGCGLSSSEMVKVRIQNLGSTLISTVPIIFDAGLGNVLYDTSYIALNPGDSVLVTFRSRADLFDPMAYPYKVYTNLTGDIVRDNDTLKGTIISKSNPTGYLVSSGSQTICEGDSVQLTLNTSYSFIWNNFSSSNRDIYTKKAGKYSAVITSKNGCKITTNEVNIKVRPLPFISLKYDATGRGKIQFLSTKGLKSYTWKVDGKVRSGNTGDTIQTSQNGVYQLFGTDSFGCNSSSDTLTINRVGIENISLNTQKVMDIFPNPIREIVNIKLLGYEDAKLRFLSIDGKLLKSMIIKKGVNSLDCNEIQQGTFLIEITTNDKILVKQCVKE